jgi:hypothetical protein
MRTHKKLVLAMLTGALVLSGIASASASAALPEFKTSTQIRGTGGEVLFEQSGTGEWTCTSTSLKGSETGGTKTASLTITFKGCTFGSEQCGNPASSGTFTTDTLTGTLGYVNKSTKAVGLSLKGAAGETYAEYECESARGAKTHVTLSGSLIGALTPVDKATTHYELSFHQLGGSQEIKKFEEGLEDPFEMKFGSASLGVVGVNENEAIETEKTSEIEA